VPLPYRWDLQLIDPTATVKIVEGINDYLDRHGFKSVSDLVGLIRK